MKNKKSQAEQLVVWTWRVPIVILILLVFIGAIWIKFSKPFDVRPLEANEIAKKIVGCLTEDMTFNEERFNEEKMKECINDPQVFLNTSFGNKSISSGNEDLNVYCLSKEKKIEGKYLPECLTKEYSVLDSENKLAKLEVFVALGKNEKNVQ